VTHDQPVLCSAWNADGTIVFSGGCDNSIKAWNLPTNQQQVVAKHDAPVRHAFFVKELGGTGMLITGSWDKTIRYWDLRCAPLERGEPCTSQRPRTARVSLPWFLGAVSNAACWQISLACILFAAAVLYMGLFVP
jgi:WD domain, G-beta repeat